MHEEQSRFRRSLARWAVVVHGNGAPGPDLDLNDGKLGLDDGMPRAANLTHSVGRVSLHVRQHGAPLSSFPFALILTLTLTP